MKLRIASLLFLCLLLSAPAWADYDNGLINGTNDAWTINYGYVVSDTFVVYGGFQFYGFQLGVWEFPGDTLTSLDWSVTTQENGGTVLGSGTASGKNVIDKFVSSNQYGYNIDLISVTTQYINVNDGSTYWLNLQNASVASGDPVYWDENSGPSQASESALGTIPSEAFTADIIIGCGVGGNSPDCEPPTPEPSSILLFSSGILGLAGVLRRKLKL